MRFIPSKEHTYIAHQEDSAYSAQLVKALKGIRRRKNKIIDTNHEIKGNIVKNFFLLARKRTLELYEFPLSLIL